MSSEANKPRFEKALTELQIGLKVLPVGIAETGAWRYAFIYEVLPRWLPDVPGRAGDIGRGHRRGRNPYQVRLHHQHPKFRSF